jgi:hypothetical protein
VYEGHMYRTSAAAWTGHDYDPSKLRVFDAGTYRIQFGGDGAMFQYNVDGHAGTVPLAREAF